jgi:hypothetical protein
MKSDATAAGGGPVVPADSAFALDLLRGWDRFWFAPADPATLGLIRLCGGLVTFYLILVYTFDLQPLFGKDAWLDYETVTKLRKDAPVPVMPPRFTEEPPLPEPTEEEREFVEQYKKEWGGTDPRLIYAMGNPVWSVWYHVTDPAWMMVVHVGILAAVFLFAIGFCTRLTAVLTWVGAVSYIQRAPTTLFGMDAMMMLLLLYLAIGPSGAALSVDRLIERWLARRRGQALPVRPLATANFALRLMQVHFCIIYMASGLSKLQGGTWWNGTALWGVMANPSFNPLHLPAYYEFLRFLCAHRWLWEIVTTGGTLYTLGLEIGFPFLVWSPRLRWLMIAGAVLLHTGIALVMGLVGFGLFMLCLLLSFVPSDVTRRLLDNLAMRTWPQLGPQPAGGSEVASRPAWA